MFRVSKNITSQQKNQKAPVERHLKTALRNRTKQLENDIKNDHKMIQRISKTLSKNGPVDTPDKYT